VSRKGCAARVGCSGWNYDGWKRPVYGGAPANRWLGLYAEMFDTVEVNSSFYRLPTKKAVQVWADTTPDDFSFAVKASRYLTHVKRLRDLEEGTARLYERIEPLVRTRKLGPVLWQLPANFHRDDERLADALRALPSGMHAFEFRHPSWFTDDVYDLLARNDVALVVGDHPERPFQPWRLTAGWAYIRFHYGHRGRNGNYSPTELSTWAERIRSTRAETWAYFNNDWEAYAVANAKALRRALV
jgi:uncharacterized protein YecE (DUF72 family)